MTMARVAPLPVASWSPRIREALAAITPPASSPARTSRKTRPKGLNSLGTFAHHPALAQVLFALNGHVLMGSTLTPRQREMLVLRVAARRECDYAWAQHLVVGRDAGLTDEEIARIALGPDAPCWDSLDAALLRAVDELIGDGTISDGTWTILAAEFDPRQLLDLVATVGAYETTTFLMRAFAIDLDDDLRPG